MDKHITFMTDGNGYVLDLPGNPVSVQRKTISLPWAVDDTIPVKPGYMNRLALMAFCFDGLRPSMNANSRQGRDAAIEKMRADESFYELPVVRIPCLDLRALSSLLVTKGPDGKPVPLPRRKLIENLSALKQAKTIPSSYALAEPLIVHASTAVGRQMGAHMMGFKISAGKKGSQRNTLSMLGAKLAPIYKFSVSDWQRMLPVEDTDGGYQACKFGDVCAFISAQLSRQFPDKGDLRAVLDLDIHPLWPDVSVQTVEC